MADTPSCGGDADKLYLFSGAITSTLKDSEDISGVTTNIQGSGHFDQTNTMWTEWTQPPSKLHLTSGQFTSTIKTSIDTAAVDVGPVSVSWDKNGHSPWTGDGDNKIYLYSGQFTSTLKSSLSSPGAQPRGVSATSDPHTLLAERATGKLYKYSGQITGTIKSSIDISGLTASTENPYGIDWDGTNTPLSEEETDKIFILSGQFTTTVKDSEDFTAIDASLTGVGTNDATGHVGSPAVPFIAKIISV